jgi:thermitase
MTPRLRLVLFVLAASAAAAFAFQTAPQGRRQAASAGDTFVRSPGGAPAYVPDQVLVKFKSSVAFGMQAEILAAYDVTALSRIDQLGVTTVRAPEGTSAEDLISAFSRNPDIVYAHPNHYFRACLTPNDPLFKYQYALSNTGQLIGSVPGSPTGTISSDIKAPSAWEETTGDGTIVVAIVDSGVDLTHPDLAGNMKSSGRDFVNGDFDASDDYVHGTRMAGLIAAVSDNGEGIAGVAWNCKFLPVKVLDANGVGTSDKVAQGIIWAADNGASVINLSWGGASGDETLRNAVKYACETKGVVVVAAAGNDGGSVCYPAVYDDYVLAVAATDYNDARASWSNTGAALDVAAPGVRILSTVPTWYFSSDSLPYGYADGTSMSAAHVSGLAALIRGLKPTLTPAQVMNVIRYSCDDVNASTYAGKDTLLGYGRINMETALVPLRLEKN